MASPLCVTVPLPFSLLKTLVCGFRACLGFPGGSDGKESACNARDLGSIPGSGRSPGEGNGNPLHYSCPENSMDRGAWWATVHGVAKSQTHLSHNTHTHTHTHTHTQRSLSVISPEDHYVKPAVVGFARGPQWAGSMNPSPRGSLQPLPAEQQGKVSPV